MVCSTLGLIIGVILGGMVGGALAAYLLGPAYKLVKFPGNNGVWLVDKPPLPFLKGESRQISRR